MAVKYFCDACSREIEDRYNSGQFKYHCHNGPPDDPETPGGGGYINPDGVRVSGRMVEKILCPSCLNIVEKSAVESFVAIQLLNVR
jgi:hypothetical protein